MFYFNALCIEMTTEKFVCGSSSGKHPSPSVCSPWKKTPWPLEVSHEPRTSPDLTGEQWEKWFQVMTHCKGAAAKGQFNRCVCVTQSVQGIKKNMRFHQVFLWTKLFLLTVVLQPGGTLEARCVLALCITSIIQSYRQRASKLLRSGTQLLNVIDS